MRVAYDEHLYSVLLAQILPYTRASAEYPYSLKYSRFIKKSDNEE